MISTELILTERFKHYERFAEWALPTTAARGKKRIESTPEQRKALYYAMIDELGDILEYLNQYSLEAMPEDAKNLFYISLSVAEVALYVEWFGGDISPIAKNFGQRKMQVAYEPPPLQPA